MVFLIFVTVATHLVTAEKETEKTSGEITFSSESLAESLPLVVPALVALQDVAIGNP